MLTCSCNVAGVTTSTGLQGDAEIHQQTTEIEQATAGF
jgi:hypothetical protein